MERLTGKFRGRTGLVDYLKVSCNKICNRSFCEDCPIEKAFEKLAHYEDLEEQGLLRKVEQGEWIKTFRYMRKNINTEKLEPVYSCDCPICKYHTGNQGVRFNFCPNCGADMRGKKNE